MDDVTALLTNPALLSHPLILAGLAAALVQAVKIIWPAMPGDYLRLFACLAGILVVWLALDPPTGLAARKWFLIVVSIGISVGTSAIGGVQTVKEVAARRNGTEKTKPLHKPPARLDEPPLLLPTIHIPDPDPVSGRIVPTSVSEAGPGGPRLDPTVPASSLTGPGGARFDPSVPWPAKRQ